MEVKKLTLEQLQEQVLTSTMSELGYLMGRYGGPHNIIMRRKMYESGAAKKLTDMVANEIAKREMDRILSETLLSE